MDKPWLSHMQRRRAAGTLPPAQDGELRAPSPRVVILLDRAARGDLVPPYEAHAPDPCDTLDDKLNASRGVVIGCGAVFCVVIFAVLVAALWHWMPG